MGQRLLQIARPIARQIVPQSRRSRLSTEARVTLTSPWGSTQRPYASISRHTNSRKPFVCAHRLVAQRKPSSRPLTRSARPRQAALLNPRFDENGQEMALEITPRAANRLAQIRDKDKNLNLALRVTVESGGCHGFQYLMSLTDLNSVADNARPEDNGDTIFEGAEGSRIVLDEPSLELLHGSKVDYTMELIGSQFKITGNPRASSSCGCGTSFDVKVE